MSVQMSINSRRNCAYAHVIGIEFKRRESRKAKVIKATNRDNYNFVVSQTTMIMTFRDDHFSIGSFLGSGMILKIFFLGLFCRLQVL